MCGPDGNRKTQNFHKNVPRGRSYGIIPPMKSKQPTILLGITSGIAAYKMVDVIGDLRKEGYGVRVVMTKHAAQMVNRDEFAKASGYPVTLEMITHGFDYRRVLSSRQVDHIRLADSADLFVIAPATANCIAKLAHGIADDVLTTTALAATCPFLLCPSMNVHMWQHPSVQENIHTLIRRGVYLLHPEEGDLACGYTGVGRLAGPVRIREEIRHMLRIRHQLTGKCVIITAGGTSEPIDGVRVITNNASGKMGVAIARECAMRGAHVMLLFPHTPHIPYIPQATTFTTAADLEELLRRHVSNADIVFHTAAVSDFRPEALLEGKMDSTKEVILRLIPTEKIITKIKSWNPKATLVGFKAVYRVGEKEALKVGKNKMRESRADFIVVNDVGKEGIGFGAKENEGYILSASGQSKKLDKKDKRLFAREIVDFVLIPSSPS